MIILAIAIVYVIIGNTISLLYKRYLVVNSIKLEYNNMQPEVLGALWPAMLFLCIIASPFYLVTWAYHKIENHFMKNWERQAQIKQNKRRTAKKLKEIYLQNKLNCKYVYEKDHEIDCYDNV